MKRTIDVNLNNVVFHMDDDAYELLKNYLTEIEGFLSADERKEVMFDIEARVAELFNDKIVKRGKDVINTQDVEEVISVLGKPNQYADEPEAGASESTQSENSQHRKGSRKFYRDPQMAILGGVAAGTAAYLDWSVVWVRIIFILLFLLSSGTMILVYLIMWIIAPAAYSVSQRLEMKGESVTADRIKEEFQNVKNYVDSDKFREGASNVGNRVGNVVRPLFKILMIIIAAILGFVGLIVVEVLLVALIVAIVVPGVTMSVLPDLMLTNVEVLSVENSILMVISVLLMIGSPIVMIIYWAANALNNRQSTSKTFIWVVLILWLAGIFMFANIGTRTLANLGNLSHLNVDDLHIDISENSAEYVDRIFPTGEFYGIEAQGAFDLILTQSNVQSVQVNAPEDIMDKIHVQVEDNILKISTDKIYTKKNIKVYVVNPSFLKIKGEGACKISASNPITTDKLELDLYGASKIEMDSIQADLIDFELYGAGAAEIKGIARRLNAKVEGVSKFDADELSLKVADIQVNGASDVDLSVTDSIWIEANGASKVECKPRPKFVKQEVFGASKIKFN